MTHQSRQPRKVAAQMFATGSQPPAVAARLGISPRTAYRWRRVWETGSVQALMARSRGGPRRRLTPEQERQLEAALTRGPADVGYASDPRWTLVRVQALIEATFGQRFSIEGVSRILHRLDWCPTGATSTNSSGQGSRLGWAAARDSHVTVYEL